MSTLPLDIIVEEILPRLSAKSLVRFKCVSKSFKTLISSPNFANLHLRKSASSAATRLLIINNDADKDRLYAIDLDSPKTPPFPLPLPTSFNVNRNSIVCNCNGLLLINNLVFTNEGRISYSYALINPCTGFYSVIEIESLTIYGFGYDTFIDDYKFVARGSGCFKVMNLKDGEWRTVSSSDKYDINKLVAIDRCFVVLDQHQHLCHWLVWCSSQGKHRIICFDLCSETWTRDVPLPEVLDKNGFHLPGSELFEQIRQRNLKRVTRLGFFDGCVSVSTSLRHNVFDVWVMKEYGVADSWVKLFSVPGRVYAPIAYARGSSSNVLLHKRDGNKDFKLVWFNIRNKQGKRDGIHDVHGVYGVGEVYEACVVKGSLVTVPGAKLCLGGKQHGRLTSCKRLREENQHGG